MTNPDPTTDTAPATAAPAAAPDRAPITADGWPADLLAALSEPLAAAIAALEPEVRSGVHRLRPAGFGGDSADLVHAQLLTPSGEPLAASLAAPLVRHFARERGLITRVAGGSGVFTLRLGEETEPAEPPPEPAAEAPAGKATGARRR